MFSELAEGPPAEAGWPWHQCPYCEPSESSEDSRGERGGLCPCRGSCAAGDHGVGEAGSALCSVPCLEALPVSGEGPGFPTVAPGCSHTSDMWGPSAPCGYRHPSPGDITQPLVTTCEAVLCRGGCCGVGKVPGTAKGATICPFPQPAHSLVSAGTGSRILTFQCLLDITHQGPQNPHTCHILA